MRLIYPSQLLPSALIAIMLLVSPLAGLAQPGLQPSDDVVQHAQDVDMACQKEAMVAGCANRKAQGGVSQCLKTYHDAHPLDFMVSDACRQALSDLHDAHKAAQ